MIGLPPSEFWNLTPWQFKCCVEAFNQKREMQHNHDAWMMWHGAVLPRAKKFPDLSKFIVGKKPAKRIDESAIIARMKAYQSEREKRSGSDSKTNG